MNCCCFRLKSQELTAMQLELEKKQISDTAVSLKANLDVSTLYICMHIFNTCVHT